MTLKVFVARRVPEIGIRLLKDAGLDVEVNDSDTVLTKKELINRIQDKEALLSLLTDKVDEEVLSAPKLKIVSNYAVGYDNIDLRAAALRKIIVTHTPDVLNETVAEHTIALLLAVTRRIVESDKFTRQGKYKAWGPLLFLGQDAIGKTLGIIGLGRVGRAVARRAIALGMKVIYFNRSRNQDVEKKLSARYVEKETLLKEADFISIHLPLTPETRHYIGEKELSLMKRNAILVNTSRGPIVEEKGLVEALKHKRIFGAALVGCRNPCSVSKVMVQRLCLLNDSLLQLDLSCPNNIRKGVTNEPFSKTITDDLALPIPYCMDAKIQISNIGRQNCRSCRVLYSGIF